MIICPRCETRNTQGNKFCGGCGQYLEPEIVTQNTNQDISFPAAFDHPQTSDKPQPGTPVSFDRTPYPYQTMNAAPYAANNRYPSQNHPYQPYSEQGYTKKHQENTSRKILIWILVGLTIILVGVLSYFLISLASRERPAASTINQNPSPLDESLNQEEPSPIIPQQDAPSHQDAPSQQDESETVSEIVNPDNTGLVHIHTFSLPSSDAQFGGFGDGEYAVIEGSKVTIYQNNTEKSQFYDMNDLGYCDLGINEVKFDPYNMRFVLDCHLSFATFYYGSAGNYHEHESYGKIEGIWFSRENIYYKSFYELKTKDTFVADATDGHFPGRLGLSGGADFIVSSDSRYIGTMWQDYPEILRVWESGNRSSLFDIADVQGKPAFSYDGCEIATINSGGNVLLWPCTEATYKKELTFDSRVTAIQYGRGNKLAAILANKSVVVINPQTEQTLATFDIQDFSSIRLSPQLDYILGIDSKNQYLIYQISY